MPLGPFVSLGLEKRKKSENHLSEEQHCGGQLCVAENAEPAEPLGA